MEAMEGDTSQSGSRLKMSQLQQYRRQTIKSIAMVRVLKEPPTV